MTEISQIIKHENKAEEKIAKIRGAAAKEIQKKKQAIEKDMAQSSFLDNGSKAKLEKEKQEKIKKIQEQDRQALEKSLAEIKKKSVKNLEKGIAAVTEEIKNI